MKNIQTLLLAGCLALAGVCRAQSDTYAVIDLSGGWTAPSYPVSYLADVPAGGWTADHKTNSLVLRKIVESPSSYYYIGVFEVTKGQWERVTGVPFTPSDFPITGRSLTTIQNTFIDTLTVKTGILVAFPSEAQWEFACRAGTATLYHYGSDDPAALPGYAWFNDNSGGAPHAVGLKQASPWGLYDLYGNVEEICLGSPNIPLRGGHYSSGSLNCTSSSRVEKPEVADATSGFRISARLPRLTVNGGTGAGNYLNGTSVPVAADVGPHQTFVTWLVDPAAADLGAGFVAADAATTVTMPFHDVTLTVSNTPVLYTLAITNGTGSGSAYTNGQTVAITANPPDPTNRFYRWVGDTATVAEVTNASTTVTIPGTNIALTAMYRDTRFRLTVNYASGSGSYTNGQVVTIGASTAPPTAWHEFDSWSGDTSGVANVGSAPTTVTMGAADKTLTAVFRPLPAQQNSYRVLDLVGNTVTNMDAPPPGGWTDAHKTTRMVFRKIPAGAFTMGSPADETGRYMDETQHTVTFTHDFYIGVFEVTQKQWQQVMGSTPSYFTGDTLPVEQVSYVNLRGATAEANWPTMTTVGSGSFVGQIRGESGMASADLPTEAQWEFACRAGTTGAYAGDLDAMAWYGANSGNATHAVGAKAANAWGLYDMHGNVYEICRDWYSGDLGAASQTNPPGATSSVSDTRVMRGGGYYNTDASDAARCRSAYRGNLRVTSVGPLVGETNKLRWAGFRLAVPQASASYLLTVVNGLVNTGGYFTAGTQIGLTAAPAPAGMKFETWLVAPAGADLGGGFAAENPGTLLSMPGTAVTVTALYSKRRVFVIELE